MFIRDIKDREEFIAGDNSTLREIFNPEKDNMKLGYSMAHCIVRPGETTLLHRLASSEVYIILEGTGVMYIDDEQEEVGEGEFVYIPPNAAQRIKNTGTGDLVFLAIVDPAWKAVDEEVLE